eukprot:TRINITY_DN41234_c0_g1_i1.p1 TRINITY_DN41234_c0_g1~~TRINITY_DN41234_c0_g1_i1.p1  ORF type:complete len:149 (+),score=32.15 TRINITY_DN41234_c0_g1_i1:88-534(+)
MCIRDRETALPTQPSEGGMVVGSREWTSTCEAFCFLTEFCCHLKPSIGSFLTSGLLKTVGSTEAQPAVLLAGLRLSALLIGIQHSAKFLTQFKRGVVEVCCDHEDALVRGAAEKLISSWDSLRLTEYCLLYTSPSPRDRTRSRMPSSA